MNGRCDVCGCKTEDGELKKCNVGGKEYDLCVFCRKQFEKISQSPRENSETARNLLFMDTNGKRADECQASLAKAFASLGIDTEKHSEPEAEPKSPYMPKTAESAERLAKPVEAEVAQLKKQVADLNEELNKFKKHYFLSKILGFIVPVVFVFVMLIILLASGALQNIFDYYGLLSEYI